MAQQEGLDRLFGTVEMDIDLNLITEEEFTNEKFRDSPTLQIQGNIPEATLQRLANSLYAQLTTGVLTENTPRIALILAIYLNGRDKISTPLLNNRPIGGTVVVVDNLLEAQPQVQQDLVIENPPVRAEHETDAQFNIRVLAYQTLQADQAQRNLAQGNVSLRYMKFLSAYSLRLIVKSAQNMLLSKARMDATYNKMYTEAPLENTNISEATWGRFKMMLSGIPRLINTWVICTSEYETTADQDSEDAGMIRYLANLPLSFSGMHTYSLFLEVMRHTGKGIRWLLTEMCTSPTKDALVQIMDIARLFEKKKGTGQRLPTYYRYARIISPKYFTKVQTKNALSLVYLETQILRHYVDFGEQGPDKIMALAPLGRAQKDFLEAHAGEIITKITAEGDVFASESARAARAKLAEANAGMDPQEAMIYNNLRAMRRAQ